MLAFCAGFLELEIRVDTQRDVNGVRLNQIQSHFSPISEETAAVLSAAAPLSAVPKASGLKCRFPGRKEVAPSISSVEGLEARCRLEPCSSSESLHTGG